jgi:phage tail sheath gpL-like
VAVDYEGNAFVGLAAASTTPPASVKVSRISGLAVQGETLSASRGSWSNTPTAYSYQWEDCGRTGNGCVSIFAASRATYQVQRSDAGHTIRVQVTATNAGGPSLPASSTHTATAVPSGRVRVGPVLVTGAGVRVTILCQGRTRAVCLVALRLSATDATKNGKALAVSASTTGAQRPKPRARLLGAVTGAVRGGHRVTYVIWLNRAGHRLLSKHHHLRASLTIIQAGHVAFSHEITLAQTVLP